MRVARGGARRAGLSFTGGRQFAAPPGKGARPMFVYGNNQRAEDLGGGVTRKVLAHDGGLMQVEVAFEPIERIVTAQIVDWHTASMSPLLLGLASQMRTALDAMLWSGFKLLQVPDTNANSPIAVLSVKTMANGDVNIYIES